MLTHIRQKTSMFWASRAFMGRIATVGAGKKALRASSHCEMEPLILYSMHMSHTSTKSSHFEEKRRFGD